MVVGVASAQLLMLGSDTLKGLTIDSLAACGAPCAGIVYKGTGSGNGETALRTPSLAAPAQHVAPMSRPLNLTVRYTSPNLRMHTIALDGVAFVQAFNATTSCLNVGSQQAPQGAPPAGSPNLHLKMLYGGADGTGSAAACSDANRTVALNNLATCLQIPSVEHLLRRDDDSGTTDVFKALSGVTGFCNGTAPGPAQTDNADNDPIRKSCIAPIGGCEAPTPCRADNTEGLVVAISDNDNVSGSPTCPVSATVAIGKRISNRSIARSTVGFSGLEGLLGNRRVQIDTTSPSIPSVRQGAYAFARSLLINQNLESATPANEQAMLDFMFTRCNIQTFVNNRNFIPCEDACGPAVGNTFCRTALSIEANVLNRGSFNCGRPGDACGGPSPQLACSRCCNGASAAGVCTGVANGGACTANQQCVSGVCSSNVCGTLPAGSNCTLPDNCASGQCNTICDPAKGCFKGKCA